MTRRRISVAVLTLGVLSCSTFGPDYLTGDLLDYGSVTVVVNTSNVKLPPSGTDTVAVALDSAIQGAYLTALGRSGDSLHFTAVLGGIHQTTVRGVRATCGVQSRTTTDTAMAVGIDRTFIVENGYRTVVTYSLTCPAP